MKYLATFLLGIIIATMWNFTTNRHAIGFVYYCGVAQGARLFSPWQCDKLRTIVEWL